MFLVLMGVLALHAIGLAKAVQKAFPELYGGSLSAFS
jgi:hypothetical protein